MRARHLATISAIAILSGLLVAGPADADGGDVNTGFGDNGVVADHIDHAVDAVVRASGKVVTAGGDGGVVMVTKTRPRGWVDTTFGDGGIASVQVDGASTWTAAVALDSLENIVIAATIEPTGFPDRMAVIRLDGDGMIDPSFGGGDGISVPALGGDVRAADVLVSATGAVVLLGQIRLDATSVAPVLVRYDASGIQDGGFGIAGSSLPVTFHNTSVWVDSIAASGSGYVVGITVGSRAYVLRVRGDGTLDTGWGTNGMVRLRFGTSPVRIAELARRPDGRLVAAVNLSGTEDQVGLAVLTAAGHWDSSFSGNGRMLLPTSSTHLRIDDMAIGSRGAAVVVGDRLVTTPTGPVRLRGFVAVVRPDGQMAGSFGGGDGIVGFRFRTAQVDSVAAVALGEQGAPMYVNGDEVDPDLGIPQSRIISLMTR